MPPAAERIPALRSYANLRAGTCTAFVCRTSEDAPAEEKNQKRRTQPGGGPTARVSVPASQPARVLLLYGYFDRRHLDLEVQLELQVQRKKGVGTLAAPTGRRRVKEDAGLSEDRVDLLHAHRMKG